MKKVSWREQHISLPEEHSLQIALTLRPNNTLKAPLSWTRSLSNMYKVNVHFWSFGAGCRARCSSSEEVGAQTDLCNLYCVWNMNSVHMSTNANPLWQNFYNYDESQVHGLVGALVFSGAGWSAWSTNSPMPSFSPLQSWWLFNEELLCLSNQLLSTSGTDRRRRNRAAHSLHCTQGAVIHTVIRRSATPCKSASAHLPAHLSLSFLRVYKPMIPGLAASTGWGFDTFTAAQTFSGNHWSEVHMGMQIPVLVSSLVKIQLCK